MEELMQNPLRQWRKGCGLTQPQVARAVGLAQSTIGRIESGLGCQSDTAYKLIEYAQGALSLWDLISDEAREKLSD